MSPQTRLRARFWPGVGYSVLTFFQSHSSSSHTSWARPVSVPWPISERAMRMMTSSLGLMKTQAPTSLPSRAEHVLRQRVAEPGHIDAQRQAAAGGCAGDQEIAAGEFVLRCCSRHGTPPQALLPVAEAARVLPAAMMDGGANALVGAAAADVGHGLRRCRHRWAWASS